MLNSLPSSPATKPAEETPEPSVASAENVSSAVSPPLVKPPPKKASSDKWSHDRFDMSEQAPKSRAELVSAYGYDIRCEDAPPKVKRSKHYGRGPSKYERNWEDEDAYGKQLGPKRVSSRAPPKGEDFPRLNERRPKRNSVNSRDESGHADGGEEREAAPAGERRFNNSHSSNNRDRHVRRQGPGGERAGDRGDRGDRGERSFRGHEKSREFKNRTHSGRSMGAGGGGGGPRGRDDRDGGRPRRHSREVPGEGQPPHAQQPSFNGLSFTNSNMGHGKRPEAGDQSRNLRNDADRDGGDSQPQRSIPRNSNYGSGRLGQRRDEKPAAQHFQQQQQPNAAELPSTAGALPLHATPAMPPMQPQQLPKRYSEKRQGMRTEQNSQQVLGAAPGMMDPQLEHLQAVLPAAAPPPPFHPNRGGYVQMDAGPQMMQQPQQQQQPPPPQSQIPAQYANYYPAEYLTQAAAAPPAPAAGTGAYPVNQYMGQPGQGAPPPVVAQQQQQQVPQPAQVGAPNGPPGQTQLLNYVPTMQPGPQQAQSPAQYSQYPGYQNYAPLVRIAQIVCSLIESTDRLFNVCPVHLQPLQAPPPPSNVTYYAPPAPAQAPPPQAQQAPPPQARAPLPQRRPTHAIPIMAPPDRNPAPAAGGKGRGRLVSEAATGAAGDAPASTEGKAGDDIDHILDNMFVRRPQQPGATTAATATTTSSAGRSKEQEQEKGTSGGGGKAESGLDEGMKDLRLNSDAAGGSGDAQVGAGEGSRTEATES